MLFKLFIILGFFITSPIYATTLDEKIGQMIMVGFHGGEVNSPEYLVVKNQIEKKQLGGVILFAKNILNPLKLKTLNTNLKNIPQDYPLFISIDQEGGRVARMNSKNGFQDFLTPQQMAKTKSYDEAYLEYSKMAKMLSKYFFNVNFAPAVDLAVNEKSIIAKQERAYGKKVEEVVGYAKAFMKAHSDYNIINSPKHFPGHGSPVGDTHTDFVDITNTWSEKEIEPYVALMPYMSNQMVMVAHVSNKNFDKVFPASMSKKIISNMLREDIGFDGVVITDDLDMQAIADNFTLEEVVINSINAGVDILLFSNFKTFKPSLPVDIIAIVKKAIVDGKIEEERINESFARITKLKKNI